MSGMRSAALHPEHPLRIFFISALISIGSMGLVWYLMGPQAAFLTFVLMLVEVTFSFDNAIINARILATMNRFWQQMFITVGLVIAVFGMRLVFPIVLVMITTGLGAGHVVDLALNHPEQYSQELELAHPLISSFGGMFLLMLGLAFFFDPGREERWINVIERPLQRLGKWWIYTGIATVVLAIIAALPWNEHPRDTLIAGGLGIILQLALSKFNDFFTASQAKAKTSSAAMAGFMAFLYLMVLDSSFSFDGVLGAFAITSDVILIAVGLGIGALWVRSLTIFMVRKSVLGAYRYLEHGAHYTIVILSFVLLGGLFIHIPELVAGLSGITIVAASIASSVLENRIENRAAAH
jgi:hypothetical protein